MSVRNLIIFLTVFFKSSEVFASPCGITNWINRTQFGPECRYICRCENPSLQCDQTTGECPGRCQPGWMGPACQYSNVAFHKKVTIPESNNMYTVDGNMNTCTKNISRIQIDLEETYPVSRLTVSFTETGTRFKILLRNGSADMSRECYPSSESLPQTVQVVCGETIYSRYVLLETIDDGMADICEIEVNGGRNVALLRETKQSSVRYMGNSSRAVDGGTNNGRYGKEGGTCIHTEDYGNEYNGTSNPWWQLDLQSLYDIWWFGIVNNAAPNNRSKRLNGFVLSVANESFHERSARRELYRDINHIFEIVDYRLNFTNITHAVAQYLELMIPGYPKIIHLCEIRIFGDCPVGTCGLQCDKVCRCKISSYYNVLTGMCPYGCELGWKWSQNTSCSEECDDRTYGDNCIGTCHNCYNDAVCDKVTGVCPNSACKAGWSGHDCNTVCTNATYGRNCKEHCGRCQDRQFCDVETGACPNGSCDAGYNGSLCKEECVNGTFGANCKETCGRCRIPKKCDIYSGHCVPLLCEAGWRGNICKTECQDRTYGYNCSQSCLNCHNEVACDKATGACPEGKCASGWNGTSCDVACIPGTYGPNCQTICGRCQSPGTCDTFTGQCLLCEAGWRGDKCDKECQDKTYGYNCSQSCLNCHSGIACNKTTGACPGGKCAPGWNGTNCDIELVKAQTRSDSIQNNAGAIAGGVVAIVVVIIAALVAAVVFRRRYHDKNAKHGRTAGESQSNKNGFLNVAFKSEDKYVYENSRNISLDFEPNKRTNEEGLKRNVSPNDIEDTYYNIIDGVHNESGQVPLTNLWDYVQENCIDTSHLEEEFSKLPNGLQLSTNEATKPENVKKNRYKKIYPYDHSRVILKALPGSRSDYINASFIQVHSKTGKVGYGGSKPYIAAQGATANNIEDFCRMLWQQDCGKIVMLTNVVENGTVKCVQYWPGEGEVVYGRITVVIQQTEVCADYTVRTLILKSVYLNALSWEFFRRIDSIVNCLPRVPQTDVHTKYKSEDEPGSKLIKQFHYTAWPDKDVPGVASSIVQFWSKVKSTPTTRKGPVIVHCSAGIGRTGTFIALDYLVEEGKATDSVNLFNCVKSMREQRVNMVQTKEQYVFLHEALVEALMLSGTSTTSDKFPAIYDELQQLDTLKGKTKLSLEFERLQEETLGRKAKRMMASQSADIQKESLETVDEFYSAKLSTNVLKNRFSHILASDQHRPYLQSNGDSDYINAVYLPSHRSRNGFIITQMPLRSTVVDFWRLIDDKQLNTVVMMDQTDKADANVGIYWPEEAHVIDIGDYQLQGLSEITGDTFIIRDIRMTNTHTGDCLNVRQFQYTFWPDSTNVPPEPTPMFNLFEAVQDWQRQTMDDSPILVHCLNGADRSGLYCVLSTVLERLNIERDVAVTQTIKKMRVRRQQIIPNFDQFQFCYEAVLHYMKTFDTYSNFA